jgi:two-component system response regulator HydG
MRCALLEDGAVIAGHAFSPVSAPAAVHARRDQSRLRHLAETAIADADGNKSRAADRLGITRRTLYAWLRGAGGQE